jgi:23S rRNA (guanosine2251-2'-O)-methyltransferase
MKTEILYGLHPVLEALNAGRRSFFSIHMAPGRTGRPSEKILELAREKGIPVKPEDAHFFAGLGKSHQSVAATVSPYPTTDLARLLSRGENGPPPFLLLLDRVMDPQNCGALIRTALCAGVFGVILAEKNSSPLSPAVSKASSGAMEHMPAARVVNMVRAMKTVKKAGLWIYGLDPCAKGTLWEADLTGPLALVVGGEGTGVRRLVQEECDALISIPQKGPVHSLNASVAGALAMYEAVRQREGGKKA